MRSLMLLLALTLVAGCDRAPTASADPAAKRLRVAVVRPDRRDMVRRIDVPGDVEGLERVALHSRASGFVREMRVDAGDPVKRDQVLAVIEAPEIQAQATRAKSLVEAAKVERERAGAERKLREVTLERKKNLAKEHGVTAQEVDEAEATVVLARAAESAAVQRIDAATAALAEAEAQRSFTEVKAPFDGLVVERRADPGAFVPPPSSSSSTPLLIVVRTDVVRIWIDVPEPDAPFVSVGQEARVRASGPSVTTASARISRFAGALDTPTRTLRAAIDVENPGVPDGSGGRALRPGEWVHVRLDLEKRPGVLTVPAEALIVKRGKSFVIVVEEGKARRKRIETGADDGERVEVLSGIGPEAAVVTEGKSAASEGSEVTAVEAATGGGPPK